MESAMAMNQFSTVNRICLFLATRMDCVVTIKRFVLLVGFVEGITSSVMRLGIARAISIVALFV